MTEYGEGRRIRPGSPCESLSNAGTTGAVREHCLRATNHRHLLLYLISPELRSGRSCRVAQGTRRATNLGSPSLAYLSWRSKKGKLPPGNPRLPSSAKRYTAAFCEYQLGFRLRGDDGISNPSTRAPPSPQCRHHPHQCLSFNSTAAKFAKPIYRFHHARQPHWPNFPTASSRPTPANPACNKTRQPKRADCRR